MKKIILYISLSLLFGCNIKPLPNTLSLSSSSSSSSSSSTSSSSTSSSSTSSSSTSSSSTSSSSTSSSSTSSSSTSSSSTSSSSSSLSSTSPTFSDSNVMKITVNGSLCPASAYFNEPCVSITICVPGSNSQCQTISNILLDTGSYGLRIFHEAVSISLPSVLNNGQEIGTCATFGTGADWGKVVSADIIVGNLDGTEIASSVPIQLINSNYSGFSSNPSWCNNGSVDLSASSANYNGILGVGVFQQDCGYACAYYSVGMYYSCDGISSCNSTTVPLSKQVTNPISMLPTDNNGIIISLPQTTNSAVTGMAILGINTKSNNIPPSTITVLNTGSSGQFQTNFNGKTYSSILDTGTNTFSFYDAAIPICSYYPGFYCPTSTVSLNATMYNNLGQNAKSVNFTIDNAESLFGATFNNIGTNSGSGSSLLIWGLPYFYGKTIYEGFEGKSSNLATGAYWAF